MKTVLDRRKFTISLALLFAGGGVARSDDGGGGEDRYDDHDQARNALDEGRVRPLADILASVGSQLGGEVVGVEFESKDGRYIYEFKVITPSGRLREVEVDAMTAEILKSGNN